MRSDVHFAALKAAAKVAFSVALLNGCSGALETEGSPAGGDGDDYSPSTTAEADIKKGSKPKKSLGKKPCPSEDASTAPPASCEAVLAAAFPNAPGPYQWEPVAQSKEVVACCDAELTKHPGDADYHWECCTAYDPNANDGMPHGLSPQDLMLSNAHPSCTPWGPPVPPSMKRPRRAKPAAVKSWFEMVVA